MTGNSQTPMERITRLEDLLDELQSTLIGERSGTTAAPAPHQQKPFAIWPADELLLTRLWRRSPSALSAYLRQGEMFTTGNGDVLLEKTDQKTYICFCEIANGDALLCVPPNAPDAIFASLARMQAFKIPEGHKIDDSTSIQMLPLFRPIERGKRWKLWRAGEINLNGYSPLNETENLALLSRLEKLERNMAKLAANQQVAIQDLKNQLAILQEQMNTHLRIHLASDGRNWSDPGLEGQMPTTRKDQPS